MKVAIVGASGAGAAAMHGVQEQRRHIMDDDPVTVKQSRAELA